MKSYYNAKDVQTVIGCGPSLAYKIIRQLQRTFEKKYPEAISIQGKIPIWYFEEVMVNKKQEN